MPNIDIILLRFDAPLMSFGGPTVDALGVTELYPAQSMLTGLLANALGFEHAEYVRHQALQNRLQYAVRQDRAGRRLTDFHTIALGQDHLLGDRGWTTRGQLQGRGGGSSDGTHIRYQDYLADAIYTVAITLTEADESPTLTEIEQALKTPVRPLFLGRKTCLPSTPLFLERTRVSDLRTALQNAPLPPGIKQGQSHRAWWPTTPESEGPLVSKTTVTDSRDWQNQIHVGQRWVATGLIQTPLEETP